MNASSSFSISRLILDKWIALNGCSICGAFGTGRVWRRSVTSLRPFGAFLTTALLLIAIWPTAVWAAPPTPALQNPSIAELEQLVDTLKDDKARQAFVAQLQTLIATQRAALIKPNEPSDLISLMSPRIDALGEEVLAGVTVFVDAPLLLRWVKEQLVDEATRARWIQVAYSLVIVFAAGLIAEWITRRCSHEYCRALRLSPGGAFRYVCCWPPEDFLSRHCPSLRLRRSYWRPSR
jgi:hypothetical protein